MKHPLFSYIGFTVGIGIGNHVALTVVELEVLELNDVKINEDWDCNPN
jgi:hypothetical protein